MEEDLFKTTLGISNLGGLFVEVETNDGYNVICNPGLYFNKYPQIEKILNQSSLDEANSIASILEKITKFPGYPLLFCFHLYLCLKMLYLKVTYSKNPKQ